jgi:hypothetical protein
MTRRIALALAAMVALGACSTQTVSTPGPDIIHQTQAAPTQAAPTEAPTSVVTPVPVTAAPTSKPPTGLSGQDGITKALTDPGSLGMTLAEFVSRWNSVLENGSHPLKGAPELSGNVFSITPEGASHTYLVGILNDDGTMRAVDAASFAKGISDPAFGAMAGLEAVSIWSVLGRAVNPRLTQTEGYIVLTDLGMQGGTTFGLFPPLALDLKGVRYYIIEGDRTTDFVARPSD